MFIIFVNIIYGFGSKIKYLYLINKGNVSNQNKLLINLI